MAAPDDGISYTWLIDHLWVALAGLLGVLWNVNAKQIKDHKEQNEKALHEQKFDTIARFTEQSQSISKQGQYIAKLFDEIKDTRAEVNSGFAKLNAAMADRNERLITALHTGLAGKQDKE